MSIRSNAQGFTLIEVMVSLMVFSVLMSGIIAVFSAHAVRNTSNEIRLEANAVAQQVLDDLRQQQNTEDLPTTGSDAPEDFVVDRRTFQVTRYYCQDPTYCTSLYNRHITVEVAFDGQVVATAQTVYTRLR